MATNMVGLSGPLILYTTPEKFFVHSTDQINELMVIDRVSNRITVEPNNCQLMADDVVQKQIYGIVGIINLIAGPYLIIINNASVVGDINGQNIYRMENSDLISFTKTDLHLTEEQKNINDIYISMVKSVLNTPYFYFSYTWDVTHSLQRINSSGPDFLKLPVFQRADKRFVWNEYLMKPLINKPELTRYCLPLMHGFISIHQVFINSKTFKFIIISRRSIQRAGTRYFVRGADLEGNVANFVETEQIIEYMRNLCSFVQVRGSIPLLWQQFPNLALKPAPAIVTHQSQAEVMQKHLDSLTDIYGKVVFVNLIDQKGCELPLEAKFREMFQTIHSRHSKYEYFDFHKECKNMRYDRLDILLDRLGSDQQQFNYFFALSDGKIASTQQGIFRVNCIDSLDRTNVVQSLIAKKSLYEQLKKLNILLAGEKIEDYAEFYMHFRNVWADNADICSLQYAGTGALKTDYTRTGKRTQLGMLRDGLNSAIRYFKNNFADGFRQDAMDLFLGRYSILDREGKSYPSPMAKKDLKYYLFFLALLGSAAMFLCSLIFRPESDAETMMILFFWAAMIGGSLAVVVYYRNELVDSPRLCPIRTNISNN